MDYSTTGPTAASSAAVQPAAPAAAAAPNVVVVSAVPAVMSAAATTSAAGLPLSLQALPPGLASPGGTGGAGGSAIPVSLISSGAGGLTNVIVSSMPSLVSEGFYLCEKFNSELKLGTLIFFVDFTFLKYRIQHCALSAEMLMGKPTVFSLLRNVVFLLSQILRS